MMKNYSEVLDQVDLKILDLLQHDSSVTNVKIGEAVGVSPPTVHTRIKRLQELGFIERYTAQLNPRKLGYDLQCVIHINLSKHNLDDVNTFRDELVQLPEVRFAYQLTGSYDYLVMVLVRDQEALRQFLMDTLTAYPSVERIQTSIVLDTLKQSTVIPIEIDP